MTAYSLLDRLLHRAALQFGPVAELSFDLDQKAVATDASAIVDRRHVFVAGLARAGTTILMRHFHRTGAFRSLTYRDMPFVLAPGLWGRLTKVSTRTIAATERAHGDGIRIDADSPESLDETFWRVFDSESYIAPTHLSPHAPDRALTERYVRYINAILAADAGGRDRYLSKNNNNILRLGTIRRAFPRAILLVPFREPARHAASLLRQHRRFSQAQADDQFVRAYMHWLAHHEFGLDHRPFRFDADGAARLATHDRDTLDYWLELWRQTYAWLETHAPEDAIFVCYEDLCRDPSVWRRLAAIAEVDGACDDDAFVESQSDSAAAYSSDLLQAASAIYDRLRL